MAGDSPTPVSNPSPSALVETEPEPSVQAPSRQEKGDENGWLGSVRLGGYIGSGLPSIVSFGGILKPIPYVGLGVNFGMIPGLTLPLYGEAKLSYREYDGFGHIYPFKDGFFLGAGLGYHQAEGRFKKQFSGSAPQGTIYTCETSGSVRSMIITPRVGWHSHLDWGLLIGFDVGLRIPIKPSEVQFDTNLPDSLPKEVMDEAYRVVIETLDKIGRTVVPAFNIRLGFMF